MAFRLSNLGVLGCATGFTLWHYRSNSDMLGNVFQADYFKDAGDLFYERDQVHITANDGCALAFVLSLKSQVVLVEMCKAMVPSP